MGGQAVLVVVALVWIVLCVAAGPRRLGRKRRKGHGH
jgi:hypothetical protein